MMTRQGGASRSPERSKNHTRSVFYEKTEQYLAKNHSLTLKCLIPPQPANIFRALTRDFLNANSVMSGITRKTRLR
jgi:hypothetical protein